MEFYSYFYKRRYSFYAETSLGYFETLEVMTILNLLQVLDNPIQDIPLLSVLHSPIYHFTAEELMQIRMMSENKEDNYYDCAQKCIQEYEQNTIQQNMKSDCKKRLKMVFDNISDWRKKARESSISQLLWYLYSETDILIM